MTIPLESLPIPEELEHDDWLTTAVAAIAERGAGLYPKPVPQFPLKRTEKGLRSEIYVKD